MAGSGRTGARPYPNSILMASTVYLETTIPSYLTVWRSPELSMAAKQQTTRQWWEIGVNTLTCSSRMQCCSKLPAVILMPQSGDLRCSTGYLCSTRYRYSDAK